VGKVFISICAGKSLFPWWSHRWRERWSGYARPHEAKKRIAAGKIPLYKNGRRMFVDAAFFGMDVRRTDSERACVAVLDEAVRGCFGWSPMCRSPMLSGLAPPSEPTDI